MTAAHTSGPWEFVDKALVGPKIDDKPIWLRPVILRSEVGVKQSDAQLISAAPDLLAALQALMADFGGTVAYASCSPQAVQARAAINKAIGAAA